MKVNGFSVAEVATRYGVKAGTVHQWIFKGYLRPSQRLGNYWVISRQDLRAFERERPNLISGAGRRGKKRISEKKPDSP